MKTNKEIYCVADIETDGPIPGPYSMLSLGAVMIDSEGVELGSISLNFERLEGAGQHPSTMEWWKGNAAAYEATRVDAKPPGVQIAAFRAWVRSFPGKPVFVGYPAGFDWTHAYWYLMRFGDDSPFSFSAIDMKTLAMALLGTEYRAASKRAMPREWFNPSLKHTHVALDDAREQAYTFARMLAAVRARGAAR
jgi:hypothetical protein